MTRHQLLSDEEAWLLTDRIGAAYVFLAEIAGEASAPHRITLAELVALAVLAQCAEGLGQAEWGRLQGVSRQRAHVIAQGLQRRGLVQIERDGRDSIVRFTRAGLALVRRLRPSVGNKLARALSGMSASDARRLSKLLAELLGALGVDKLAP